MTRSKGKEGAKAPCIKRTYTINGRRIRYPLSEWQDAATIELTIGTGKAWEDVADALAAKFFSADLQADYILGTVKQHGFVFGEALLQSMLDEGAIDALTLYSLVSLATERSAAERQRAHVTQRHARTRKTRDWVVEHWERRAAGQFQTKDHFVEWCMANCPGGIEAAHERVRDKWLTKGKANLAGIRFGR